MKYLLPVFLLLLALACDNHDTNPQTFKLETHEELVKRAATKYAHVKAAIEDFIRDIPRCSTEDEALEGWCAYQNIGFETKQPSVTSRGQRILVVDDGMRLAAYTRYKSRVIDMLDPTEHGSYESTKKTIEIQKGSLHVLSAILNDRFPDTPSVSLTEISHGEYPFCNMHYPIGHGERIFGTLADLNPEAEFVLVQNDDLPKDRLISAPDEDTFMQVLRTHLLKVTSSLMEYIRKYEINYVNMSFGHTVKTIKGNFEGQLSFPMESDAFYRRVIATYKENYYDRLFSLRDVIFVQAATWSSNELQENDPDNLVDCTSYSNRIRVGVIEELSTDIPFEGARRDILTASDGARACIDVFINSGVIINSELMPEKGEFPYLNTFDGIGVDFPNDDFGTSWAAPMFLSYLNYKNQEARAKGQSFSIDSLHKSQLIFEPVKYRQFELFRTGIL